MMSTDQEKRLIKSVFERAPTLFQTLATVRTRRMGRGYCLESGCQESHGATANILFMDRGPLAYTSVKPVEPLSELEQALICWAACGPTGIILGDIGVHNNLNTLLSFAGRTIPSANNDLAVDLIFTDDNGVFLYRPSEERTKAVEVENEEDYPKIIEWFRKGKVRLQKERLDIDWSLKPGRPMGVWQYNLNRPGSVWFLPVADVAKSMINTYFSVFENMQWLIIDEETGRPAGDLEKWAKPGYLEVPITERVYEEVFLHMCDYQVGMLIQNIRLAAEAMGLGCWIFGGFCEDMILGGFRPLSKGLRFRYRPVRGKNNYVGIPNHLEGFGLPAAWNKSPEELVDKVISMRYKRGPFSKEEQGYMGPYRREVLKRILDDPKLSIPEWCIEATKSLIKYFFDRYERYPVYYSTYHANLNAQVHHLDEDFYDKYYQPGYLTSQHYDHFNRWHK